MAEILHFNRQDASDLGGVPLARNDSFESAFFAEELKAVLPEIVEVEKGRLNFLDKIPTRSFLEGYRSIAFNSATSTGKAQFVGPKSQDLPVVNSLAQQDTVPYRMIGVAVVYDYQELRAMELARRAGLPVGQAIEASEMRTARRAIEELVNKCAWYGDADAGIRGLLQQPEILSSEAANALGGSTTADQCINVLNAGANAIPNNTNQVEEADTLLLPPDSFQYVSQQIRSSASDTTTLDFWLKTNGYVDAADKVRELSNATILTAGAPATTDCAIFYRRSPDVLELPYSGIKVLPTQQRGLSFIVPFVAFVGGLMVKRPKAIHVVRGV